MIIACKLKGFYKEKNNPKAKNWISISNEYDSLDNYPDEYYEKEFELCICSLRKKKEGNWDDREIDILKTKRFSKHPDKTRVHNISFHETTFTYFEKDDSIYLKQTEIKI